MAILMYVIGLTGGIGSGKSTSCQILKVLDPNLVIVDADSLSHEATKAWNLPYVLLRYFILTKDCFDSENGTLIRSKLAQLIFAPTPKARALKRIVERLIHPWVIYRMLLKMIFCWLAGESRIVLDIPLLFEAKLQWMCSKVILIDTTSEATQILRILKRNSGTTEEQARDRINSQMAMSKKRTLADVVVNNDGDVNALKTSLMREFPPKCSCRMNLLILRYILLTSILFIIYILLTFQIK